MDENVLKKQRGKPFKKGESGNPAGKPPGTQSRTTVFAQALLDGQAEALVQEVIELALGGDISCLKLCLERLIPPCKEIPISITLPKIESLADVPGFISLVIAELGSGRLTPGEAKAIVDLTEEYSKAIKEAESEKLIREYLPDIKDFRKLCDTSSPELARKNELCNFEWEEVDRGWKVPGATIPLRGNE